MKSFILVGDKSNALGFIKQIETSVTMNKDVGEINGQAVRIYFEPNVNKVINKEGGAIIVVTGNDNKIPANVEVCYSQLPADFTLTYAKNNGETPIGFVRQLLKNPLVQNDGVSYAHKIMFTLFGGNAQQKSKNRLLSIKLEPSNQKTTMSA